MEVIRFSVQRLFVTVLVILLNLGAATTALAGETITFFHNDVSGTPMLATNAAGNVVWKENYRPYGDRMNYPVDSFDNNLWFAGKPHDIFTGLSYMGARYYDPMLGRFMGIDPKGFDPENLHSFNRYTYANNNPYRFVDPDGHSPIDVVFLAYDVGKLGVAMYTGAGVREALIDVAASVVGVASPVPGSGQAIKAARATEKAVGAVRASDRSVDLAKKTTESGIGVTQHSVQQKINRQVRSADELDAIKNPLDVRPVKIDSLGRPSQRSIGRKAEVSRNPETGDIVSVNPTSSKKAERLLRRKGGQG